MGLYGPTVVAWPWFLQLPSRRVASTQHHAQFVAMLPQIRKLARLAFRAARPELKEELIAEVVANAFCAFNRLVERGKEDIAYATPLAAFAVKQVRSGRRVGGRLNVRDITSRHAQLAKGIAVAAVLAGLSRRVGCRLTPVYDACYVSPCISTNKPP